MKLEYLIDGSPECPLIRLYDFTPAEAGDLRGAVSELASEAVQRIEVHGLPFVDPVGGCELALVRKSWDQGVLRAGTSKFECGFTAGTWDNVAGLIEPFAEASASFGFQWLAESTGEAALLLSVSGRW
jgi:hypothetical protein